MCVERVKRIHPEVSERRACRALSQPRSTQRHHPRIRDDEEALRADIIALATRFGRYGYRRITALLRQLGWQVNHKRVERIWRREGLRVPMRQRKQGRLWLGDNSLFRLRSERVDHVWAYDFVACRTHLGKPIRLLTVIDEWSRECLAIKVAPRLQSDDVLATLTELMMRRGVPEYIRRDNGPEFTARRVREWIERIGAKTLFIEPENPWPIGFEA